MKRPHSAIDTCRPAAVEVPVVGHLVVVEDHVRRGVGEDLGDGRAGGGVAGDLVGAAVETLGRLALVVVGGAAPLDLEGRLVGRDGLDLPGLQNHGRFSHGSIAASGAGDVWKASVNVGTARHTRGLHASR